MSFSNGPNKVTEQVNPEEVPDETQVIEEKPLKPGEETLIDSHPHALISTPRAQKEGVGTFDPSPRPRNETYRDVPGFARWAADKEDGRRRIWLTDGTRRNYARWKKERELGFQLPHEKIVTHRDGNLRNDRLDNLRICDRSEHVSRTHAGRTRDYPADHATPTISDVQQRLIPEIAEYMERTQHKVNKAEIARAVGIADITVTRYLDAQ